MSHRSGTLFTFLAGLSFLLAAPGTHAAGKGNIADAIRANDVRLIKTLLAADPELIHQHFGPQQEPILSFAMHTEPHPRLEMLKALIEAGADVNAVSRGTGFSPLMEGADHCHVAASLYLLEKYDAEPDVVANDGSTALIVATISTCPEVVEALIKACARLDAKFKGALGPETALDIAREQNTRDFYDYAGNKKVLKLLEDAKKNPKCPAIRRKSKG